MNAPPPTGRQRAASFVHQKIGRRKVPVMTVNAGDGDVATRHARRGQGASASERTRGMTVNGGATAANRSRKPSGPAMRSVRERGAVRGGDRRTVAGGAGDRRSP